MHLKYGLIILCDQNCGVQSMNKQTDKQTDRWKGRIVNTEGPKIMYIDIRYIPSNCDH